MKKISLSLLMFVVCFMHSAFADNDAPDPPKSHLCCADYAGSLQRCCEVNYNRTWCPGKQICVGWGMEWMCDVDYSCTPHTKRLPTCLCDAFSLDVWVGSSSQVYCCSSSDKSRKSCCEAMGFTWEGSGNNSGMCLGGDADVCVEFVQVSTSMSKN